MSDEKSEWNELWGVLMKIRSFFLLFFFFFLFRFSIKFRCVPINVFAYVPMYLWIDVNGRQTDF